MLELTFSPDSPAACGERSERVAIRVRGSFHERRFGGCPSPAADSASKTRVNAALSVDRQTRQSCRHVWIPIDSC